MIVQRLLATRSLTGLAAELQASSGMRCSYRDVQYMLTAGTVPAHWLGPIVELARKEGLDPGTDDILSMLPRTRRGKDAENLGVNLGEGSDKIPGGSNTPKLQAGV